MTLRVLFNIHVTLKVKGQMMYSLVNASPPKPFDIVTANFVDA